MQIGKTELVQENTHHLSLGDKPPDSMNLWTNESSDSRNTKNTHNKIEDG